MANLVNLKDVDATLQALNVKLKRIIDHMSLHPKTWSNHQEEQITLLADMQTNWIDLMNSLLHNNRDGRG